jgi:hypothetical protein
MSDEIRPAGLRDEREPDDSEMHRRDGRKPEDTDDPEPDPWHGQEPEADEPEDEEADDEEPEDVLPEDFSPAGLMRERIAAYWRKVLRSWRTAWDWTAGVYIVAPFLWIGGNMYAEFWREPPGWAAELPAAVPSALLALAVAVFAADLRTFADPGDGLFLRRNRAWTRRMIGIGMLYTLTAKLVVTLIFSALLLPYHLAMVRWPAGILLWQAAGLVCGGYVLVLVRDAVSRRWSGWRRRMSRFAAVLIWAAAWGWAVSAAEDSLAVRPAAIALIVSGGAILSASRLKAQGTLFHEVETERDAYSASIGWLLVDAPSVRSLPRGRRPIMFRGSRPLLPGTAAPHRRLADLWLKSQLRRFEAVRIYGALWGIGTAAIAQTPMWLAVAVWLVLGGLMVSWLNRLVAQWYAEPYMKMFPWSGDLAQRSADTARIAAGAPAFALWGLAVGVKAGLLYGGYAWLAAAAAPAAGWWLYLALNGWMAAFMAQPAADKKKAAPSRNDRPPAEETKELEKNS